MRHRRGHRRWASNATPDEEAVGELESFSVASLPGFPHPTKVRDGELVLEKKLARLIFACLHAAFSITLFSIGCRRDGGSSQNFASSLRTVGLKVGTSLGSIITNSERISMSKMHKQTELLERFRLFLNPFFQQDPSFKAL